MEERILELFRTRPKEILFADAIADAILHEEYEGVYPKDPAAPSASSDELQERFFAEVTRAIKHLVSSGRLMMSKSGRVGLPEAFGYILGIILINDKGYGFFRPVGGGSDRKKDVFVRKTDMKGALHRDTVLVKIKHSSRGAEAEISKIVKRATETFIGTFEGREVIPNDKKIYRSLLVTENPAGAKPGDVVMVQVTGWGDVTRAIRCRITEILGRKGDKGIDILSVAKQFGLEATFPEAVLQEAERLSEEFPLGTR
ncbi:MAG: hypothetical protein Q4A41_05955, partial [Bacillota bacterium]|nr:hypothetical protein [Bacillota bacterium]